MSTRNFEVEPDQRLNESSVVEMEELTGRTNENETSHLIPSDNSIDNISKVFEEIYKIASIITNETEIEEQLKEMKKNGFDFNQINEITGKAAIHYACAFGNDILLRILVNAYKVDINLLDLDGSTALHSILKSCYYETKNRRHFLCFQFLLSMENIEYDLSDRDGYTPLHYAAAQIEDKKEAEKYINELKKFKTNIDLDAVYVLNTNELSKEVTYVTARESLDQNLVEFFNSDIDDESIDTIKLLFEHFKQENYTKESVERFIERFETLKVTFPKKIHKFHNERLTFLQLASAKGLHDLIIKADLLGPGSDVNACLKNKESAIELACKNGHPEVVSLLLEKANIRFPINQKGETLLHISSQNAGPTSKHHECVTLLLEHCKQNQRKDLDVNSKDNTGKTPLHYSVLGDCDKTTLALLNNGAHIDIADNARRKPITSISYETFKLFLDSKITENGNAIKMNYESLLRESNVKEPDKETEKSTKKYINQLKKQKESKFYDLPTSLLSEIKRTEDLRKLIDHPILSTLIMFKWDRIFKFFLIIFIIYFLFSIFFTITVFANEIPKISPSTFKALHAVTCFLESLLILNEITIVTANLNIYRTSPDGVFRVTTIIVSLVTLCYKNSLSDTNQASQHLISISVLLVWVELFFVGGKFPIATFYVKIFKRAFFQLLYFLLVHIPILLGFALSFHKLFGKDMPNQEKPNIFANGWASIFKTFVMLTGEYDASDLSASFAHVPVTSHIVFVAFICVVSIVIVNSLISIANNATKNIENEPFLHSCIAQIWIIEHMETSYFGSYKSCSAVHKVVKKIGSCVKSWFKRYCCECCKSETEPIKNFKVGIYPESNNGVDNFFYFTSFEEEETIIKTRNEELVGKCRKMACFIWSNCFFCNRQQESKGKRKIYRHSLDKKIIKKALDIINKKKYKQKKRIKNQEELLRNIEWLIKNYTDNLNQ